MLSNEPETSPVDSAPEETDSASVNVVNEKESDPEPSTSKSLLEEASDNVDEEIAAKMHESTNSIRSTTKVHLRVRL